MFFIGLALLSAVSSLKVFGENRPMFWRESANGISVGAFFTARALGDLGGKRWQGESMTRQVIPISFQCR